MWHYEKTSHNANPNFITIGDKSLIETRSTKTIIVDNGDLNFETSTIVLGDFIPFYFGIKMPMLYVMQNGGNFVEKATPPDKIVYLVCSVQQIIDSENIFYFSDGHATDSLTRFYDKSQISELPYLIDWIAIKAPYWGGPDNLDLKRKKQAEFLVLNDLSPDHLFGYVCYDENAKQRLVEMGVTEERIKIVPKAYY